MTCFNWTIDLIFEEEEEKKKEYLAYKFQNPGH